MGLVVDFPESRLVSFFETVLPHLGERQRRIVVGAMSEALGRGGQVRVAQASGMSSNTVNKAVQEVRAGVDVSDRQRAPGGGDKPAIDKQPGLLEALDALVWPKTRGHPMSPLRWTLTSTYELARQLKAAGFEVSAELVRRLLGQMGYSLQPPGRQVEGASHPDRDAQFAYLNEWVADRISASEPVIAVDTTMKELKGLDANDRKGRRREGEPQRVNVNDFDDPRLAEFGKVIPFCSRDDNDEGWVNVGDVADSAEFAVESIRRWWKILGRERFPTAATLTIAADAGSSNGYRPWVWKWHLAKLATETGLAITVLHYPPGTSKWNKIEHRLVNVIPMSRRGGPLADIRTVVELVASASTRRGLTVQATHDPEWCPKRVKITDAELSSLPLSPHVWHGEWNYTVDVARSGPYLVAYPKQRNRIVALSNDTPSCWFRFSSWR